MHYLLKAFRLKIRLKHMSHNTGKYDFGGI